MNATVKNFKVWVALAFFLLAAAPAVYPRTKTSLNGGWKFTRSDERMAMAPVFDDRSWQRVDLPHTWNVEDTFDDEPGYYRGVGWYRRVLNIRKASRSNRLFLYFEGANQVTDVYVNGAKIGSHTGGYTAFAFDMTDVAKPGRNIVAVRVDNSFNQDIPPLTADFNFYGGIYRDVWLIETSDVHLDVTDHASPGVRITTPDIENGKGTVAINGVIAGGPLRDVTVLATVVNGSNGWVNTSTSRPDDDGRFSQSLEVPSPELWSPESPYLYKVRISVRSGGRVVDEITQPIGFRWLKFDAAKGFSLNGKPLRLFGTNRHQDYKGLGNAVPDRMQIRDIQLIKDAGFNFVRLAHYPQDPAVLEACDRLGLLVWEETPIVNYITKSDAFNQNSATMLRDMIRQHRNHPSVALWGYMNEIFLRVPKGREDLYPATVDLARELNRIAKEEDPTRPTTIAFHGSEIYNTTGLANIPDVIGWNLYQGWYSATVEDFGKFLDDQHRRFPKRPLIVSEYGANGDRRLSSSSPRRFDSTTEYQRYFHESYFAQIKARPYLSASTIWNEFDFGAEQRGETNPHLNQKGMYTYDRKPKDVHFFYKAQLSKEDVVHIAASDQPVRSGLPGETQRMDVYTNRAAVELALNGRSLGLKTVGDDRKASWDVVLLPGKNNLAVVSRNRKGIGVDDSRTVDFRPVSVTSDEIAVNVGSNADFIDADGHVWIADQPYVSGRWGFVGPNAKRIYSAPPDANIFGTDSDPLFQTMVEGLESYRIDVPDGDYQVELLFAETKFAEPHKRVFDVSINGKTVVPELDLAAAVGRNRPYRKAFSINAKGGIVIGFVSREGEPELSGVRITRRTK